MDEYSSALDDVLAKVISWHEISGNACTSTHHRSLTSWPCAEVRVVENAIKALSQEREAKKVIDDAVSG